MMFCCDCVFVIILLSGKVLSLKTMSMSAYNLNLSLYEPMTFIIILLEKKITLIKSCQQTGLNIKEINSLRNMRDV